MEALNEKSIGGWKLHKKANPSKEFKKKIKCGTCDESFISTLEKNIKKEEALIFLTTEDKQEPLFLCVRFLSRDVYNPVIKYSSSCPNCGYEKELFCVPKNSEKVFSDWENDCAGYD